MAIGSPPNVVGRYGWWFDGYGFKSIKWLQCMVLTNDPNPNDTYAGQNNDVDTTMKTFAPLRQSKRLKRPTGGARRRCPSGMSGLRNVSIACSLRAVRIAGRPVSDEGGLAGRRHLTATEAFGRRLARWPVAGHPAAI